LNNDDHTRDLLFNRDASLILGNDGLNRCSSAKFSIRLANSVNNFLLVYRIKPGLFPIRYDLNVEPNNSCSDSSLIKIALRAVHDDEGSEKDRPSLPTIKNLHITVNCKNRIQFSLKNLLDFKLHMAESAGNQIHLLNCVIFDDLVDENYSHDSLIIVSNSTLYTRRNDDGPKNDLTNRTVVSDNELGFLKCLLKFMRFNKESPFYCKMNSTSFDLSRLIESSFELLKLVKNSNRLIVNWSQVKSNETMCKGKSKETVVNETGKPNHSNFQLIVFLFALLFVMSAFAIYSSFVICYRRKQQLHQNTQYAGGGLKQPQNWPLHLMHHTSSNNEELSQSCSSYDESTGTTAVFTVGPENYFETSGELAKNDEEEDTRVHESKQSALKIRMARQSERYRAGQLLPDSSQCNPLKIVPRLVSSIEKAKRDMEKKRALKAMQK
jgi:hypothetical protein